MEFLRALEGWGIPLSVLIAVAVLFILLQFIGELVEVCGKTAPTFLKIRKWFKARKEAKKQRELQYAENTQMLKEIKEQQTRVESLLAESAKRAEYTDELNRKNCEIIADFNAHYCPEKIAQRDKWMLEVNSTMHWAKERAIVYDASVNELKELAEVVKKQSDVVEKQSVALDLNNKMTSDMYKHSCRRDILDFEHKIINARKADKPLVISREEFRKIRKTYDAYEEFLQTYGGTNGEVDDAMEVIRRAERGEYSYIEFLEDLRD